MHSTKQDLLGQLLKMVQHVIQQVRLDVFKDINTHYHFRRAWFICVFRYARIIGLIGKSTGWLEVGFQAQVMATTIVKQMADPH